MEAILKLVILPILSSVIVLNVFYLILKPCFKISSKICFNNDTLVIKVINCNLVYPIYDIKFLIYHYHEEFTQGKKSNCIFTLLFDSKQYPIPKLNSFIFGFFHARVSPNAFVFSIKNKRIIEGKEVLIIDSNNTKPKILILVSGIDGLSNKLKIKEKHYVPPNDILKDQIFVSGYNSFKTTKVH